MREFATALLIRSHPVLQRQSKLEGETGTSTWIGHRDRKRSEGSDWDSRNGDDRRQRGVLLDGGLFGQTAKGFNWSLGPYGSGPAALQVRLNLRITQYYGSFCDVLTGVNGNIEPTVGPGLVSFPFPVMTKSVMAIAWALAAHLHKAPFANLYSSTRSKHSLDNQCIHLLWLDARSVYSYTCFTTIYLSKCDIKELKFSNTSTGLHIRYPINHAIIQNSVPIIYLLVSCIGYIVFFKSYLIE